MRLSSGARPRDIKSDDGLDSIPIKHPPRNQQTRRHRAFSKGTTSARHCRGARAVLPRGVLKAISWGWLVSSNEGVSKQRPNSKRPERKTRVYDWHAFGTSRMGCGLPSRAWLISGPRSWPGIFRIPSFPFCKRPVLIFPAWGHKKRSRFLAHSRSC